MIDFIVSKLPIIAQARSFSNVARNVTNITNPVSATVTASKLIIDVCTPPHIKYLLKCAILLGQVSLCICSGGASSATSVALAIGTAKQILEEVA